MNLIKGAFPYFVVPLVLSLLLVPIAKKIGLSLNVYAVENKRTVHHGKIVRMGGLAIFLAYMISLAVFVKADYTWNGVLMGGTIVFVGGLLDDIYDLKPVYKLAFQGAGALCAIFVGKISLGAISLPFGITIDPGLLSFLVSFVWIVGVTNAINLIDGLDGLSGGICFIVLCTIGLIGYLMGRRDICVVTLILAGAILGFLRYNFHPASIFMGDCGALFLGFTIACISLMGFKTTTFVTLALPILILFIPISDTLIAMLRRKLKGVGMMSADKSHMHHILMYRLKLGHRNAVLVLYAVAMLFGLCAILMYMDETIGVILLAVLLIGFELFIESTDMVNPKFHPLIGLSRRLIGWPKKKEKKEE